MKRGIVRNIDHLNRVVVPKEFYRTLGINPGDAVEISLHGDEVRIRKNQEEESCALCCTTENLQLHFTDKLVCKNCLSGGRK